jgi:hypothetical protein
MVGCAFFTHNCSGYHLGFKKNTLKNSVLTEKWIAYANKHCFAEQTSNNQTTTTFTFATMAMTKMSLLRELIGVEDIVETICKFETKSNYNEVLTSLHTTKKKQKYDCSKLKRMAEFYFVVIANLSLSIDEEREMFVWPKGEENEVLTDVTRDVAELARSCDDIKDFKNNLKEMYGHNHFLSCAAIKYMTVAMNCFMSTMQ